jgi:hypothetical protein
MLFFIATVIVATVIIFHSSRLLLLVEFATAMYCYYYLLPCNASGICYCHVLLVLLNMMAGTLL